MIGVHMDEQGALTVHDGNEAALLLQAALDVACARLASDNAERHTVRAHEVAARIGNRQPVLPHAERKAHSGRDEVSVESLHAALQKRLHDERTRLFTLLLRQSLPAFVDRRLQDLRYGQIRSHGMVRALRHRLGGGDERRLHRRRQHALRVEDAVLERLAEFRRGRVILPRQPLRNAAQELREHDARGAACAERRRARHASCKPADALILHIDERHDCRAHRAQHMRARKRRAIPLPLS